MLFKAKIKSKSKRLPVKAKAKAPVDVPVIIKLRGGMEHKSTLNRLKSGLTLAPDPIMYVETANTLWGGGKWTSAELRSVLIQMESEGMSQRDALESLRASSPPMPSYWTVRNWLSAFPDFGKAHKIAEEMLAAMKLEAFGEHWTLEAQQRQLAGMSDEALDRWMKTLLADNRVRKALESKGIRILDAEIVAENA